MSWGSSRRQWMNIIPHPNGGQSNGLLQKGICKEKRDELMMTLLVCSPALPSASPLAWPSPTLWNNHLIMDTSLQVPPQPGLPAMGVSKFALCLGWLGWGSQLCLRSLRAGSAFSEDLIEWSHCDTQTPPQKPQQRMAWDAILFHTCYTAPMSSFTGSSNVTGDTAAGLGITRLRNRGVGVRGRKNQS